MFQLFAHYKYFKETSVALEFNTVIILNTTNHPLHITHDVSIGVSGLSKEFYRGVTG